MKSNGRSHSGTSNQQSKLAPTVYGSWRLWGFPPAGGLDERLLGDALTEFVFGRPLTNRIVLTERRVDPVPKRWPTRGHQACAAKLDSPVRARVAFLYGEFP